MQEQRKTDQKTKLLNYNFMKNLCSKLNTRIKIAMLYSNCAYLLFNYCEHWVYIDIEPVNIKKKILKRIYTISEVIGLCMYVEHVIVFQSMTAGKERKQGVKSIKNC